MSRRLLFAFPILALAALAGAAATEETAVEADQVDVRRDIQWKKIGKTEEAAIDEAHSDEAGPASARPTDREIAEAAAHPSYTAEISITKDGKRLFAPKIRVIAGTEATVLDEVQRPFVVGIDEKGEPIVKVFEEGVEATLPILQCRDGVATLDATVTISEIEKVGLKGAAQSVRLKKRETRIVEQVLLGDDITATTDDGIEFNAVVRRAE